MRLLAEFEIDCDALPLVGVAAAVPEATLVLELQFTHGDRPLFLLTAAGESDGAIAAALDGADDVGEWTLVGGRTREAVFRRAFVGGAHSWSSVSANFPFAPPDGTIGQTFSAGAVGKSITEGPA